MTDLKNSHEEDPLAEKLSSEELKALSNLGWRVPQTVEEVAQTEAWLKENHLELPGALQKLSLDELSQKLTRERRLEH
jgi:hypothetical protein